MGSKTPLTIVGNIPADTTETFEHEFTDSGTLTAIKVSTYVGHEFGLRYTFEVVDREGNTTNLLKPLDKDFLAGNGENFNPEIRQDYAKGDELVVSVENTSTEYQYHYNAMIESDSMGGMPGIFGGIMQALGGSS